MPIYEYECKTCGLHFERKQGWQDDPLKECPECNGKVRKLLHPVGIVFKGSGFYKTDYPSSAARQEGKTETKTEGKATTTSEGKETSKPESKPEAESKSDRKAKE